MVGVDNPEEMAPAGVVPSGSSFADTASGRIGPRVADTWWTLAEANVAFAGLRPGLPRQSLGEAVQGITVWACIGSTADDGPPVR